MSKATSKIKLKSTRPDALRKRAELIQAATSLFTELGFEGASIDELVKRAGVSKATIYSHFGDKQGLFIAVSDEIMDRHLQLLEQSHLTTKPLKEQLALVADQTMSTLLTEEGIGIARMTFANARRFPDIAKALYKHGFDRAVSDLSVLLAPYTDEPKIKAEYFWAMLMHRFALEGYLGVHKPLSVRRRKAHADRVINDFLKAFLPHL